jgi:carboxymethylenebutenolidase
MRLLLSLCLLLAVSASKAHSAAPPQAPTPAVGTFLSGGKKVRVERFEPKGSNRLPAVLLPGLDGIPDRDGMYRCLARRLAARGYVVLLVHYFGRTETKKADLPNLLKRFRAYLEAPRKGGKRWRGLRGTFEAWLGTVVDAVAHARTLPRVDPDRVGLAGFSLGGFLATSAAMRPELRIACVVELFGGLPAELAADLKHMPPTLILHGDRDTVVPVRHAHALRDALAKRKLPCEPKVYPGVGHGFEKPGGGTCWWAALDAEARACRFLKRHLAPRKEAPVTPARAAR